MPAPKKTKIINNSGRLGKKTSAVGLAKNRRSSKSTKAVKPAKRAKPARPSGSANPKASAFPKRLEVVYKGRVQGVGFRFNVEKVALQCGVTGWVRNENNGDVHVVAEGPESALNELLEAVRQSPVGRFVGREQVRWEIFKHEFSDFKIEYHF
jgi:acylphosphatase